MKPIANIVTTSKIEFNELYNIVGDVSEIIADIPTLVIGWKKVKECFGEVDILDWRINDLVYWTFNSREKRNRMLEDIEKFYSLAIDHFLKSIKYEFIDLLIMDKPNKRSILNKILDSECKVVYINNDMLYISFCESKYIIGISLYDIEYGGGDRNKILSTLHKSENVFFIKDKDDISLDIKYIFKNHMYAIPCLYN